MVFDAVYHMRIPPAHALANVPRDQVVRAPSRHAPVGDAPYRVVSWKLRESVFQNYALVPPGPVSQAWPLWQRDSSRRAPPPDTAQAAALLTRRGWRDTNGDGIRDKGGVKLAFHILVPTTSAVRRQYARLLQEQFRTIGAQVELDEVENAVMQQRATAGKFDAVLATWATDPTPTSNLADTWTRP